MIHRTQIHTENISILEFHKLCHFCVLAIFSVTNTLSCGKNFQQVYPNLVDFK